MRDDDDSELFEGRLEISRTENGASFGLDEESYFRMATCAMNASGMGIEPSVICRLPDSERGCKLVSFGRTHAFSVVARVFRSRTTIALVAEPLDGLHCTIPSLRRTGLRRSLVARASLHVRDRIHRFL
jgi:hypothetical protein